MKVKLFLFVLCSLILGACTQKQSLVDVNDQLVTTSELSEKRLEHLDLQIDAFFEKEDFSEASINELMSSINQTKDSINSDLAIVKELNAPNEIKAFQETTTLYIQSLINQTQTYSEQYAKLGKELSNEEYAKMDEIINQTLQESENKLENMIKTQIEFSEANKIELTR